MKFTIIVPIFNRESSIENVIKSVLKQSYPNWELLLVDDGSTDSTADICRKAADTDSRIRYLYKINGGVSSARNYGINETKGDFIVFLDSDNTLTANTLSTLCMVIQKNKDIDFLVFGYNTSSSSKWIPAERDPELFIDRDSIRKHYLPTHFNIYKQDKYFLKNFVWNKAYKASFINENRIYFDESRQTWEDGVFVINCLDKANKIAIIPKAIYNAYCDKTVDHLSSKLYINQVLQYINDEREYKARFGEELDFSTEHYISSNFRVISSIFERTIQIFGNEARGVIDSAIKTDIVKYWAEFYRPKTKTEMLLRKYILDEHTSKIYNLFRLSLSRKLVKKVINNIRH